MRILPILDSSARDAASPGWNETVTLPCYTRTANTSCKLSQDASSNNTLARSTKGRACETFRPPSVPTALFVLRSRGSLALGDAGTTKSIADACTLLMAVMRVWESYRRRGGRCGWCRYISSVLLSAFGLLRNIAFSLVEESRLDNLPDTYHFG